MKRLAKGTDGGEAKKSRMERCCFLDEAEAWVAGLTVSKSSSCKFEYSDLECISLDLKADCAHIEGHCTVVVHPLPQHGQYLDHNESSQYRQYLAFAKHIHLPQGADYSSVCCSVLLIRITPTALGSGRRMQALHHMAHRSKQSCTDCAAC